MTIDNILKNTISTLDSTSRKFINLYVDGVSFDEISKITKQGSKQRVSAKFSKIMEYLYSKGEVGILLEPLFTAPKGKEVFIDAKLASPTYWRILLRMGKTLFKLNIVRKQYLSSIKAGPLLYNSFNDIVKTKGLPLKIDTNIKKGKMSDLYFRLKISHSSWIIDSALKEVIANEKVGFFANFCLWEKKTEISLWTVYNRLYYAAHAYTIKHKIDTPKKLGAEVMLLRHHLVNEGNKEQCSVERVWFESLDTHIEYPVFEKKNLISPSAEAEIFKIITKIEKELHG